MTMRSKCCVEKKRTSKANEANAAICSQRDDRPQVLVQYTGRGGRGVDSTMAQGFLLLLLPMAVLKGSLLLDDEGYAKYSFSCSSRNLVRFFKESASSLNLLSSPSILPYTLRYQKTHPVIDSMYPHPH